MARTATATKTTSAAANNPSWLNLTPFCERYYTNAYYGLRSAWSLVCRGTMKEKFDSEEFNEMFTIVFGKPDEKKFSAQDLGDTAIHYFGIGFKDLVRKNLQSLKNRKKQIAYQQQSKTQQQVVNQDYYDEQF
ncbi:hypothetical protein CAL7716_100540 (plasmid) [Calothrix sp. PCC 7716]|nr:hypothetical protein CAL7716_100540 [Calothrix sp. PCC 7716]